MSGGDVPERAAIDEVAEQLGHLRWLELALFEVLGEAVTEIPDASAKLAASLHSRRAGERAERLGVVIPLINGLDAEARTVPPLSAAEAIVAEVRSTDARHRPVAVASRLVPLVLDGYDALLAGTGPVADAPVRRVVSACRADLVESGKSV